jgi:shikimate kinase
VLIGMMGSGKTVTGRAIADRLDRPFRDSDVDLEAREGATGAEIAARDGIDRLHELEEELLLDALASDDPTVITAAGWVVESGRCRRAMTEEAFVVWLDAPTATLLPRMAAGGHRRPLDRSAAQALLDRRRRWFERLADLRLDALEPPDRLVEQVLSSSRGTR